MLRRLLILAALTAFVAAGCGSSSKTSSGTSTTVSPGAAAPTTAGTPAQSGAPATIPEANRSPAGKIGTEPTVKLPTGPAPSELQTADLIVGTGAAAANGSSIVIQYVGASFATGKVFDASWSHHQTLPFTVGQGEVITGMDQGVIGMKVGGRREIIIPPALGYGANPQQGSPITPNETLIFIVDLVSIG